MPYIKEVCVAGKTIEVSKYYSVRWHCVGEHREPREKEITEAQKRVNQRQASTTLRRLMNHNFKDGDLLVRLDFSKEHFPEGSEAMQLMISKIKTGNINGFCNWFVLFGWGSIFSG